MTQNKKPRGPSALKNKLLANAASLGLTEAQIAAIAALSRAPKGDDPNAPMAERIEYAIKRRELALRRAKVFLHGADGVNVKGQGRGGVVQPVSVRIGHYRDQIASLSAARDRAESRETFLPDDIATLETALARCKAGDTVEFPNVEPLEDDTDAIHTDPSRGVELEQIAGEVDADTVTADEM